MARPRTEAVVGVAAVMAAAGLVAASTLWVPEPPRRMALPTASELVELERYLRPVAVEDAARAGAPPRVAIDGSPFGFTATTVVGGAGPGERRDPPPRWAVTAIMIAGDRRMAIVNDRLVRPGDRLGDGARIATVERDYVVLITPDGQRRRLELER